MKHKLILISFVCVINNRNYFVPDFFSTYKQTSKQKHVTERDKQKITIVSVQVIETN